MKRLVAKQNNFITTLKEYKKSLQQCIKDCDLVINNYDLDNKLSVAASQILASKTEQMQLIYSIEHLLKAIADNQKYNDDITKMLNEMLDSLMEKQRTLRNDVKDGE